jgi:L-aspartate oxidase
LIVIFKRDYMSAKKVLIIGEGIAGSVAAIILSEKNCKVTIVSNDDITNSDLAQGGIVYKGVNDSPSILYGDIMTTGGGVNNQLSVKYLCDNATATVEDLLIRDIGVVFDVNKDNNLFDLTKEAAHSCERIIHCGDATGHFIMQKIREKIARTSDITKKKLVLIDLIVDKENNQCVGASFWDGHNIIKIYADEIILATGGAASLYEYSTNRPSARGDGIAAALRQGVVCSGMEYIQFHPTTFHSDDTNRFLITEAMRGEGAEILDYNKKQFLKRYHHLGSLAPRDIVARAIFMEMQNAGVDHLWLDISFKDSIWIKNRFPIIYKFCLKKGCDITKEPIPISPAAHYLCGGVEVDIEGNTSVNGLRAVGEVAMTGVHGANRLASTSLLEAIVFAKSMANDIGDTSSHADIDKSDKIIPYDSIGEVDEAGSLSLLKTIKQVMWENVGVVRTEESLYYAKKIIGHMEKEMLIRGNKGCFSLSHHIVSNALTTCMAIINCAINNKKSIGCHYIKQ